MVKKRAIWPHHHIFTPAGQPAKYADISLPQFALGYAVTMNQQKDNMRDLMSAHFIRLMRDADKHKWEDVRAFHGAFLTSIEMGRCAWEDKDFIQEMRHDMIVDKHRQPPAATKQQQRYTKDNTALPAPLSTLACSAFQTGKCSQTDPHGKHHHVCSFCLRVARRMFPHAEAECRRKAALVSKN